MSPRKLPAIGHRVPERLNIGLYPPLSLYPGLETGASRRRNYSLKPDSFVFFFSFFLSLPFSTFCNNSPSFLFLKLPFTPPCHPRRSSCR